MCHEKKMCTVTQYNKDKMIDWNDCWDNLFKPKLSAVTFPYYILNHLSVTISHDATRRKAKLKDTALLKLLN